MIGSVVDSAWVLRDMIVKKKMRGRVGGWEGVRVRNRERGEDVRGVVIRLIDALRVDTPTGIISVMMYKFGVVERYDELFKYLLEYVGVG